MKQVQLRGKLGKGKFALVDGADFQRVVEKKWYLGMHGYPVTSWRENGLNKSVTLHRFIMGDKKGVVVDHINRNKLDNRRENLRFVENWVNVHNSGTPKNNISGRKGVSYCNSRTTKNKYKASICIRGKTKNGGYFATFEEALKARLILEKKYVPA